MGDRHVVQLQRGMAASDGAGVRLSRIIGAPGLDQVDPFLLLDEFGSDSAADYLAGFPDHPHRGFETVTYMLAGAMRHGDHAGHQGRLVAGSVQWMTAGRGIVHSEMPEQEEGLLRGFQLWVNLPASEKLCAPRYQEFPPSAFPERALAPGVVAKIIAGNLAGFEGPVRGIVTDPLYVDVRGEPGASLAVPLPVEHSACVYAYEGELTVGAPGTRLTRGALAVLSPGDVLPLQFGTAPARALVLAARPLREPVARYGPFVMNTRDELVQAFRDYEAGRLG